MYTAPRMLSIMRSTRDRRSRRGVFRNASRRRRVLASPPSDAKMSSKGMVATTSTVNQRRR